MYGRPHYKQKTEFRENHWQTTLQIKEKESRENHCMTVINTTAVQVLQDINILIISILSIIQSEKTSIVPFEHSQELLGLLILGLC